MTSNSRRTTWNGPAALTRPALESMCYSLSLIGLVTALAVVAQAQDGRLGRGVRMHQDLPLSTNRQSGRPDVGERRHYYGILGPVGQPGTYASDNPRMTLAELVANARGLTPDAAPLAKVIRHGRANLQFVYSPTSGDQLTSGDVVVFGRVGRGQSQPTGGGMPSSSNRPADDSVGVAFVGIQPLRPVVIPLDVAFATVPQVIVALHQPPALVNTVQVIRTSPTAPRIAPGQRPAVLRDGDVVVFQPTTIDRTALAKASPFPSPIPIDAAQSLPTGSNLGATNSWIERPGPTPSPASEMTGGPALSGRPQTAAEPARSFEQHSLPPLSFSEASDAPTSGLPAPRREVPPGDMRSSRGAVAMDTDQAKRDRHGEDSDRRVADPADAPQLVVPTGLVDRHTDHLQSLGQDQTRLGEESIADDPTAFAADSFSRLALADSANTSRSADAHEASDLDHLDDVPTPFDRPTSNRKTRLGSRTSTLGIIVLMIAVICFAASLLWSRLDDGTGRVRAEHVASSDDSATAQRHTLDRLIDNSLPVIEEQESLPERIDYHGRAVGRRRIRIDAGHDVTGPHFVKTANRTPGPVSVAAETPPTVEKPIPTDAPPAESNAGRDAATDQNARSASGGTGRKVTSKSNGGLLERVLVAMEREKQQ